MISSVATGIFVAFACFSAIYIIGIWKAFEKAGEPGWAAVIPFYNWWVMLRIARKPAWWFPFLFLPVVNLIVVILTLIGVARNFGESEGFGLGLSFLGFIFWPMLGFGDQQFMPPNDSLGETFYQTEPLYEDEDPRQDDWDPLSDRQKF